jgi:hypothetical protein
LIVQFSCRAYRPATLRSGRRYQTTTPLFSRRSDQATQSLKLVTRTSIRPVQTTVDGSGHASRFGESNPGTVHYEGVVPRRAGRLPGTIVTRTPLDDFRGNSILSLYSATKAAVHNLAVPSPPTLPPRYPRQRDQPRLPRYPDVSRGSANRPRGDRSQTPCRGRPIRPVKSSVDELRFVLDCNG